MKKARSPEAERVRGTLRASLIYGAEQNPNPKLLFFFSPFVYLSTIFKYPDLSFNWRLEKWRRKQLLGKYYQREMFGRVRASPSPSSLDSLETPPSKIIKDDSLSIYEATLMKLKLGSQRRLISPPMVTEETDCASETVPETTSDLSSEAINVEAACSSGTVCGKCQDTPSDDEAMVIDADCCSASVSNVSSGSQSTGNLNSQQWSEGMSILYLFNKFKGYQRTPTISHEAMMIENDGSASFSNSSINP